MHSVGLKALKNSLSRYVRLAARGETVLVTDRDRVVAEIVPPSGAHAAWAADEIIAGLMKRGLVTPPAVLSDKPLPRKPVMTFEQLMKELDQDREDRDLSR